MDTLFNLYRVIHLIIITYAITAYGSSSPVRTLAKGQFGGITKASHEIIKDQAAWKKLWEQNNVNAQPEVKIPKVNFAKEMVIMVTMGQQRTGGYAIEIVKIEPAAKRLNISVRRVTPPSGAMLIQTLTSPFHIVAVPKSDLSPEFLEIKGQ
jgi:hypothetical protein